MHTVSSDDLTDSITDHIRENLPQAVANLLLPLLSCPLSLLSLICFAAVCTAELLCHCGLPFVVDHAAAVAVAALVVSALAPVRVEYLHALCGVWDMWYGTVIVDTKIWVMNCDI